MRPPFEGLKGSSTLAVYPHDPIAEVASDFDRAMLPLENTRQVASNGSARLGVISGLDQSTHGLLLCLTVAQGRLFSALVTICTLTDTQGPVAFWTVSKPIKIFCHLLKEERA